MSITTVFIVGYVAVGLLLRWAMSRAIKARFCAIQAAVDEANEKFAWISASYRSVTLYQSDLALDVSQNRRLAEAAVGVTMTGGLSQAEIVVQRYLNSLNRWAHSLGIDMSDLESFRRVQLAAGSPETNPYPTGGNQ